MDGLDFLEALGVPAWIIGAGLVVWLWLGGRITRTSDCNERLEAARVAALAEATVDAAGRDRELAALQARFNEVYADRNAWRDAHSAEVEARRAAEQVSAELLQTSNIAVNLLEALKAQMGIGSGASRGG